MLVFGHSVQGRRIVAMRYGSPTATRVSVIIGSMHGTELGGLPIVERIRREGAPRGTAMWLITTINPDGTVVRRRQNAHGVDLNRDGSHLWKGTARSREYYPGPRAVSEPETRAYMGFLALLKPDMVLVYHQAGNGIDSYQQKDPLLTRYLHGTMALPIKSFNCAGECTGTLTGWFNSTQKGAAITIELPRYFNQRDVARWSYAARVNAILIRDR